MSTALIVYGSTTGNTEFTAETIEGSLSENGYDVSLLNVSDTTPSVLKDVYDLYLLGSSTWGDDDIEFQEDFAPFFDGMGTDISLDGKKFAIFGCGDSTYEYFCGAVDELENRVQKMGANLVYPGLRIDGEPEEDEIKEWAQDMINAA